MISDKIKDIVDMLIISTTNGQLKWIENTYMTDSIKRQYQRRFYAYGEDGTKYETDVKFDLSNNNWILEKKPSLFIRSEKLPNGEMLVYGGDYVVYKLRDLIISTNCQDMKPSEKIVEDALDLISKGISVTEYRDSKLNKILK